MGSAEPELTPSGRPIRRWFDGVGGEGFRTLEQQVTGLDSLLAELDGMTVLDVGCAEGLIAAKCAQHGAVAVTGIDIVAPHIDVGRDLFVDLPVSLLVEDANAFAPEPRSYDVVLLLAVLHKLRDPAAACARLADAARSLCVIRMPAASGTGHTIIDARSQNVPADLRQVMRGLGFNLQRTVAGPFDEATHYWRR